MGRARAAAAAALVVAAAPAGGQGQDPLPEGRHVVLGRSVEGRAIRAVRVGDLDAAEVAEGR